MSRLLKLFVTLMLLVCRSSCRGESDYCLQVSPYFLPCISYLGGISSEPTSHCCYVIEKLNEKAESQKERGKICQCIEDMAYVMNIKFQGFLINSLAKLCKVNFSFPISNGMDCSKVVD